jgi:hypothetical protein
MGLGIYIKAEVGTPIQFSAIEDCIRNNTSGLFEDFLSFSDSDNSFCVTLHPCEETVIFEYVSGQLICSAKTSSVGPGYHAYLVELVEKIGADLGIQWIWNLEEGEQYYLDETGYYSHRNFKQLQFEMLKWLQALAKSFADEKGNARWAFSMPLGYPRMKNEYFAVSPMRIWTPEFFKEIAQSEIEELEWAAKDFFIWWDKQDDDQFYKKTGIALLNVECPWHYPADEKEKRLLINIDNCFELSKQLNPQNDLPLTDWFTIKHFLNDENTDIPDTEFGYKKHLMTFDLPGKWLIDLPGNLYFAVDGDSEVYYDHERNIRSICYTRSDGKADQEYADGFFKKNEDNAGHEFLSSGTDIAGKAVVYYTMDKEAQQGYWVLQGVRVKGDKFVFSTISYPNEDYKQWAIDTWNSIR